ncbi:MAG TPA: hypothetical protein PLH56_05005 [Candidatus Omnitrophota bacterium]|nr:hypothetical protein [Candidatus Omnitrophota bacterium]
MKFKLNPKKYFLIFSLIFFVFLCFVVGFLYFSFNAEIAHIHKDKDVLTQEVVFLRDILSRRKKEDDMMPLLEKKTDSFLMREITRLAVEHNVQFASLEAAGVVETKEDFYKKAFFLAQGTSSFKDLGLFLKALKETKSGLMDVQELVITPEDADSTTLKSKIKIAVLVEKKYGQK